MKRRGLIEVTALAAGAYRAVCREQTQSEAEAAGHAAIYPEALCISDGKWCTFHRGETEVWACNAVYAAAHFDVTPSPSAG